MNKAYVICKKDGSLHTWNCTAKKENGIIKITPAEDVIDNIHFNADQPYKVQIKSAKGNTNVNSKEGLQWIGINGSVTSY